MKEAHIPFACTIAGSDSGGGAGIQADLKTFSALGIWGCTVITAVTAQNPIEVKESFTVPPEIIRKQIEAVMEGFEVSAIKTGMLPDASTIRTVSDALPRDIPLVIDPVMIATSGKRLIEEEAVDVMIERLLPKAAIVTPNIPEACVLAGVKSIRDDSDIIRCGRKILDFGVKSVLIKGGHQKGEFSKDMLITPGSHEIFCAKRMSFDVHGSGCCLSAAITGGLAKNYSVRDSCLYAKEFVNKSIKYAILSNNNHYSINPDW
ncbi:bifunctional hydroxymethylpyrimidine kinase/phosphomethylpyrimidine kinase [Methanoplanus sp. FWC-SCC4]|uniref:Bifunctional hydroxymethylpyrimidine kinase/phosphomethylpyrimidine kinase n=1 Tax=Methanochimaera problematica TaxID=2609417 RepID=A0AA97FCF4_9EURY|nr:bifunctional hydroxymethylpyrimidine kinase/phosphomethylpyrimidine kinase [Methanoplanus sp. FWC-SCC4]WOF16317.1 bifunctional hydroxymethylpyrimidine kinase/phosphomethylpyrimidine kinase [Methanoplanus sp. FWC-SCC4]